MVFRRFIVASIVALALVAVFVVLTTATMSLQPHVQVINQAGHALSFVHSNQQTLTCPDAPPIGQNIVFDFCSPKYNGDVAGPSGSHIVLVEENFPDHQQTWVLSRGKSIKSVQSLNRCLQNNTCTVLPSPEQSVEQKQEMFLSWTWKQGFPQQVNVDYYFIAVIGSVPGPKMQVVSTPIGFTLLTAQPPCITLETGGNSPTNCSSVQQNYSISDQTSLTIRGINWMLGWVPTNVPITESVTISATCISSSTCHPARLFEVTIPASGIDGSGSFTKRITLPTPAKGTYTIQASDSVQKIATPGVPDTSSINTIADGSLTFGEQGDATALNVYVTLQTIPGPNIELILMDILAAIAAIPALVGICLFVVVQSSRKKVQSGQAELLLPAVHTLPLIPFQVLYTPQSPIPVQAQELLSSTSIKRQKHEANKAWVHRNELSKAVAVTRSILLQDFLACRDFVKLLQKKSPKLSPDVIQNLEREMIKALNSIQNIQDPVKLLDYCSMAIVYGSILLAASPQSDILQKGSLHYDIGFVYTCLVGRVEYR